MFINTLTTDLVCHWVERPDTVADDLHHEVRAWLRHLVMEHHIEAAWGQILVEEWGEDMASHHLKLLTQNKISDKRI